ncbi:hypothetical protein ICL16_31080 [Iningainema sp. BLCCT55]|uniref:Uncharacterized protein n=2 Tax=Iningainema TaxID=1932705 RepID=A0A8J6XNB1_9CYAN|nr:hypothetical protein [Iningainema tapete BLCC-T55]
MAERLESLKAGLTASLCLTLAFILTSWFNSVVAKYFEILSNLQVNTLDWHWWVSGAIASFSGLLFGVTYRYIIRDDQNPQLKTGGVLAFGLVRGLAQVDVGLCCTSNVLPFVVLGLESVLWFSVAAIALDTAIHLGWIKPFALADD